MTYKLGSLFDGSGGFPLAGSLCGIEPVWAAEVEPYPVAVTRSRFPNMKHYGDVSKINGAEVEPVNVLTFGAPCQDLSVAGLRKGLRHEANGDEETTRSGLFMEAVRIIKEMREATNGRYPTFAIYENVPGAFSSSGGEDWRTVLQSLVQIVEPGAVMPDVPKGGWAYADWFMGEGWSLAYRVLDAQFWGVPQRRRRIYLVLDLRGERAGKILFEREGLRGYFEACGAQRETVAGDAEGGAGADDRAGEDAGNCLTPWDYQGKRCYTADGVFPTLFSGENGGQNQQSVCIPIVENKEQCLFQPMSLREENWEESEVRNAIRAGESKSSHCVVESMIYSIENHPADSRVNIDDSGKVQTLTSRMGTGGGNVPLVMEAKPVYCLQGNGIDRADTAGCNGKGWTEDTCYTLNTIDRPAVAFAMQGFGDYKESEVASGLKARDYKDSTDLVAEEQPIALDRAFFNQGQNALYDPQFYTDGTVPTLVARGPSAVAVRYIVRRLTPTECARLQGFPDQWGHPDHKDNFTDEEYAFWCDVVLTKALIDGSVIYKEDGELYFAKQDKPYKPKTKEQMLTWYNKLHTDSSEYKMWGNGIALPCALYVMQGIEDALKERALYEQD